MRAHARLGDVNARNHTGGARVNHFRLRQVPRHLSSPPFCGVWTPGDASIDDFPFFGSFVRILRHV